MISKLVRKISHNDWHSFARKYVGTGRNIVYGRSTVRINFFRQVGTITEPPKDKLPPLVLSCTKQKIGWKVLMTCPNGKVIKFNALTWNRAIRKAYKIWGLYL